MPTLAEFLFGSDPKTIRESQYRPNQEQYMDMLLQAAQGQQTGMPGLDYLQNMAMGGQGAFDAFEAPALRQFQEQVIPGIANRFSGAGLGGQQSGAFKRALSEAGTRMTENLAGQRANLQQSALQQLMGYGAQGLSPRDILQYQQPTMGLVPGMLQAGAQGLGAGAGMAMTGGMGGLGSFMQGLPGGYPPAAQAAPSAAGPY